MDATEATPPVTPELVRWAYRLLLGREPENEHILAEWSGTGDFAAMLGLRSEDFGAKSFRIGGATDYRAAFGAVKAERLIKQRGRWWSDIHQLYERALAEEHLDASAAVGDARGAELEALCEGWAQPAEFR